MVELSKIMKMQNIIKKNEYKFNEEQMSEIHKGMQNNVDFFIYLNPKYSANQMKLIRLGLEKQYDINKYINCSYEEMLLIYNKIDNLAKLPQHIHTYKKELIENPTCHKEGIIKYTCSCGDNYIEKIAKKHNFTTTTVLPNCQNKGYTTYRCISCGYSYNDDFVDIVDHNYSSDIIQEPTCQKPGKILYKCINCNHTMEQETSIIDHKYESKIIQPTCIEEGYTLNTCIMCGHSYRDNLTEKIEHAYNNWSLIKEPTCTEKGIEEQSCLRCKTKNKKFIEPLGHKYHKTTIQPTCTEKGYDTFTCIRCRHSYNDNYIEKIPHIFNDWEIIKVPTTKNEGLRKRKCKNCDFIEEEIISCEKLTIESAQKERMAEIKKQQKSNKKEVKEKNKIDFEPLKASYTKEEFEKYIKKFKKTPFNAKQTLLIKEGLLQGLDVKIYANPKYDEDIMYELKKGIEHGINLTKYTKDYDALQINEIRLGIEHEIDYKKYLNKNFTNTQMREIRLGLEEGLNVNKIASLDGCPNFLAQTPIGKMFQPKYSSHDMYKKRVELKDKK